MNRNTFFSKTMALFLLAAPLFPVQLVTAGATAQDLIKASGVQGGLVVHAGCGTGELTASLRCNDRYLVHGLACDPAELNEAQAHIQKQGGYGQASVCSFNGKKLPYVDNLVNLLVVDQPEKLNLSLAEIARALAPRGVALLKGKAAPGETTPASLVAASVEIKGEDWTKLKKKIPDTIDEWTHFKHDSTGNAVAQDENIAPPKSLRWVAGPRWCRSHEMPTSVSAVVVSGGRIFTFFDESPSGVFRKLPQSYKLIARDADSGVLLWKVPLKKWQPEFGTGTGNRWQTHHTIPRRLVAQNDRVYVTLQFLDSPVSVLDAATGEIVTAALEGTKGTDEIVLANTTLLVKTTKALSPDAQRRIDLTKMHNTLGAVDVNSGKQLWKLENTNALPHTLAAKDDYTLYHTIDELVCLNTGNGKEVWRTADPVGFSVGSGSSLVIADDVVLFHNRGFDRTKKNKKAGLYLRAFSLSNGAFLWQRKGRRGWAAASSLPTDIFVVNGLVWCGNNLAGLDLHTGEVKKTIDVAELISKGHHYRCHHAKATCNYLILPKRGAEFVDLSGDQHMRHNWLRAPCYTGAFPANGLFYVPSSQCFCYPGAKVFGYLAMTADDWGEATPSTNDALERGPAYGQAGEMDAVTASDWPMYRRDNMRSGATEMKLPGKLAPKWSVKFRCRTTQPIVVSQNMWFAEKDAHRIWCLEASTGKKRWSYTAGGRIDSSPTFYKNTVLFGCRDGYVYCLRARDGKLVWRFRAAPSAEHLVSFNQVESVWPVQGSALVQDGIVYFAAGRSSFLNGGIIVYGLDAAKGTVRHHHTLHGPWPDVTQENGRPFAMEGALPDLFATDRNKNLYMMRIKFDPELNRGETKRESPLGELDMGGDHLAATGGFLDDTGFDRVYWMYSKRWPGFYFSQQSPKAGQLVVFDGTTTFAVKYFYRRHLWSPLLIPESQGYLLFADHNSTEPGFLKKGKGPKFLEWLPEETKSDQHRRGGQGVEKGTGYVRHEPAKWQTMIPVRVRAMVLAGDRLVVAGPPDAVKPDDPLAAFEGRTEASLNIFSSSDGSLLQTYKLPKPPAFDGISTARGSLFIATIDGRVLCLSKPNGSEESSL